MFFLSLTFVGRVLKQDLKSTEVSFYTYEIKESLNSRKNVDFTDFSQKFAGAKLKIFSLTKENENF